MRGKVTDEKSADACNSFSCLLVVAMSCDKAIEIFLTSEHGGVIGYDAELNQIASMPISNMETRRLAVKPHTNTVAVAGTINDAVVLDMDTCTVVTTLTGHKQRLFGIAYSHEGEYIATGSSDKSVIIRETATYSVLSQVTNHTGDCKEVVFSHDDSMLASTGCDRLAFIISVPKGELRHKLEGHTSTEVYAAVFSVDDAYLFTGSFDNTIIQWAVSTGANLRVLQQSAGWVWGLAVTPNGDYLVSSQKSSCIHIFDISSASPRTISTPSEATCVAVNGDGTRILAGCSSSVVLIDFETGTRLNEFKTTGGASWGVAFKNDPPSRIMKLPSIII